jgi:hypothetical protein
MLRGGTAVVVGILLNMSQWFVNYIITTTQACAPGQSPVQRNELSVTKT